MARQAPQKPKTLYVKYDEVSDQIKAGQANIGVVVDAQVNGKTSQFLIISNNNSQIVDIVKLEPNKTLSLDQPVMIFGKGEPLDSKYYTANGKAYELMSETRDHATLSAMYDGEFGKRASGLTAYERKEVTAYALSMLDSSLISDKPGDKEALISYLSEVEKKYIEAKQGVEISSPTSQNNYDVAARIERTADVLLHTPGPSSLEFETRKLANETYIKNVSQHLGEMSEQKVSGYSNELQRALAEHRMDVDTMKLRYLENAQEMVALYKAELSRDGILDMVGRTDAVSFNKINETIQLKRTQLDDYVYNENDPAGVQERTKYLSALVELSTSHIYQVESKHSQTQPYHMSADTSIYESMTSHLTARGVEATFSLDHAVVSYQGKTQREMYEYLCDKSAIVHELSQNYEKYETLFKQNAETMSISQRRDAVIDSLCQTVRENGTATIYETSHVQDFLKSDEFVRILQNKASFFIIEENGGLETRILRPGYAVEYHDSAKFDLSDPKKCQDLQKEIEKQLNAENQLHTRHSQDLLAARDFISDYIQYNQALQSAEYNHTMSLGLNVQRIEYSSQTLQTINEQFITHHKATEFLRDNGFETDFRSMGTPQQMHANYDALTYGFDEIANKRLQEVLSTLPKNTSIHMSEDSWVNIVKLARDNDLDSISESQRATLLAQAITGNESITLSKKEIQAISENLNFKFVDELSDIYKMRDDMKTLRQSLADDLRQDVQLTRGCDNLYKRDIESSAYTDPAHIASASKLDFATAINNAGTDHPLSTQRIVLDVIDNHAIRNEMIATIQSQIDNPEEKTAMASRVMKMYEELHTPMVLEEKSYSEQRAQLEESLRVVTDEKIRATIEKNIETLQAAHETKMETLQQEMQREMPAKMAEAFGINMSENADVKKAILSSNDFVTEFNRIAECARDEKINFTDNQYILTLEQTGGLDALRTIAKAEDIKNLDYTRLADSTYLDYLQSQATAQETRQAITDFKQANEAYVEMLIVARNVEELVHRAPLSNIEHERLMTTADQIAYTSAVEHDPSTSKIMYRKFEEMLERAEQSPSEYTKEKISYSQSTISTEAEKLRDCYQQLYSDDTGKIKPVVALGDDKEASSAAIATVREVITSDERLYQVRSQLEETIKSSPHYADYQALNNNTEIRVKLSEIERQLQDKQELLHMTENIMAEHQEKARGIFGRLKYGDFIEGDKTNIQMYQLQIDNLKDDRFELQQQLSSGRTTEVPSEISQQVEAYKKSADLETGLTLAREIIKNYGHEPTNAKIDEYNIHKLNEALRDIEVPYAAREDFNKLRLELLDASKAMYVEQANNMVREHIEQVTQKVSPNLQGIELSPQNIDEMIKASTTEAEKTRLSGLRDELVSLREMKFTPENFDDKILGLVEIDGRAKQLVGQFTHIEELRTEAKAQSDSFAEFKTAIQAYESLEKIRVETSMLGHDDRVKAAESALENHPIATYTEIAAELQKSKTLEGTGIAFADAFKQIHELAEQGTPKPNVLLAELDKPAADAGQISYQSIPNLDAINNYNTALSQIGEEARVKIATEIAASMGNEKNASAIYDYVFKPIEAERLEEHIKVLTSTREMIDEIAKMEGSERRDVITQGLHSDNPELQTRAFIAMSHEGALQNADVPVKDQQDFYNQQEAAVHGKIGIAEHLRSDACKANSPSGFKVNDIEDEIDNKKEPIEFA